MDRQKLVMNLKRALVLARNPDTDPVTVGQAIALAYSESGEISHEIDATLAMHGLAHRLAAKDLEIEAEIVVMAINIAAAASNRNMEVYTNALMHLHDLVCNHLDEITGNGEPEHEPAPGSKNIREMN